MKALAPLSCLYLLFTIGTAHLNAQKVSHTSTAGCMAGVGTGGAYQVSDLVNSRGYGLDFVVGSHLFHKENAFLSLDWKLGFLGGKNRAFDHRGNVYDFGGIDPDRDSKLVYRDLVILSDGDFETSLTRKAAFLPTAGIYFGYQLTRSLALGVEYKANFYLTEENDPFGIDLDNTVLAGYC